jgi:hypothetical protein
MSEEQLHRMAQAVGVRVAHERQKLGQEKPCRHHDEVWVWHVCWGFPPFDWGENFFDTRKVRFTGRGWFFFFLYLGGTDFFSLGGF